MIVYCYIDLIELKNEFVALGVTRCACIKRLPKMPKEMKSFPHILISLTHNIKYLL